MKQSAMEENGFSFIRDIYTETSWPSVRDDVAMGTYPGVGLDHFKI